MSPADIVTLSDADLAWALVTHPRWEWAEGLTMIPIGFDRERWLLCWCERRYIKRPDGTWPDEPSGWAGGAYQTSGGKWWGIAGSEDPIDLCDGWGLDFVSDANGGVLLGMLRELGMLNIGVHYSLAAVVHRRWYVSVPIDDVRFATHYGRTLAVAAARALLAAWGPP